MKVEVGFHASCSEAVFRFYTLKPKKVQKILQAIQDEVRGAYPGDKDWVGDDVPLYEKAEMYEEGTLINACAGLGDNNAVIKVEKDKGAFTLNIGNNDLGANGGAWIDVVKALGIKVQEAESCKELQEIARDCCCGIQWFEGYKGLIKDKEA